MKLKAQKPVRRSNREGHLGVICPACRRKYRIRLASIPDQAQAFRCKDCGHKIKLPAHAAQPGSLVLPILPRFRVDLMTPEKRPAQRRFLRRMNFLFS